MTRTPSQLITDFVNAWERMNIDELMAYFADDAVYHNMPGPPLQGVVNIRAGIQRFLGGWTATAWDLVNVAANGDVVFTERVDRITAGEKRIDLPVVGVFEVSEEQITAWRDYFDLATYQRGMA